MKKLNSLLVKEKKYIKFKISLVHKITCSFIVLIFLLSAVGSGNFHSNHVFAAAKAPVMLTQTHQITYFKDNKAGAISITFDDGYPSQLSKAVPELNERGLKGTFFLITGRTDISSDAPWSAWQTIAAQGHEIGSHTVTHAELVSLPIEDVHTQLSDSQTSINQNIPGQACSSLAYPYTGSNGDIQNIAAAQNYVAARAGWISGNYPPFLNYYQSGSSQGDTWNAMNFYNLGGKEGDALYNGQYLTDPELNGSLDKAVLRHAWLPIFFHDIPDANGFGDILDYIQGKPGFWIDTFCNVSRYMKERLNSTIQVNSETTSETRLNIVMNAPLSTSTYNFPLTIRSTVPASWNDIKFQQGSTVQNLTPVTEGAEKVIYYNAIPNGGEVVLTSNPVPSAGSLSPSSTFVGNPSFTLTVTGTNFIPASVVRWNGANRTTTYINSTQLTASISSADIASAGMANVTVFNPAPGGGTSNQLSFNINLPNPPTAFARTSPANLSTNQPTSLFLSWASSSGATSYEYCYDTSNDNTCSSWTSNGNFTSKALSGLTPGATYYWHVRAVNIGGVRYANTNSADFWSFTLSCYTLTKNVSSGVGGMINASPAPNCNNGTQYSYGTVVTLSTTPNANYAFSSWSGDLSGFTNPNTLVMNSNKTITATFASFSNKLSAPTLRSPQFNLAAVGNTPTLLWKGVTGGQEYEVVFAEDSGFSNIVDKKKVNALSYAPASPLSDGKYYWRVRAYNSSNQFGKWSSARAFIVDTIAPTAPVLDSPTNNAPLTRASTFKWLSVPTAVSYELQYANNAGFTNPVNLSVRTLFRRPSALPKGTYYWHVRAKDAAGNWSEWSLPFNFTIDP